MTKRKVLFVLTISLLLLINVRVNAGNPMDINFEAGYVDPYKGNDAPRAQWGLEPLRPSNDGLREVNFRVVELIM